MIKDPRQRFTETAKLYGCYRPSYPAELADWIIKTAGLRAGARVADIGCGTGISARFFAQRGFDVIGVDPNEQMLASARSLGLARYQKGEAAATGLAERSVDLAIAGQAFHWFELKPTFRELRRILKLRGSCAAFWNIRAETPLLMQYQRLIDAYIPEYKEIPSPEETWRKIAKAKTVVHLRKAEYPFSQTFDLKGFLGRVYSSSYVTHGLASPRQFDLALRAVFERHQVGGKVRFDYRTVAFCWMFSS